ncbi:hypothetical protein PRZ48_012485 [Zasmidium cellare]|uniref:2EXR domain-containing protein n=1 Tax=Zasmidium cellare TaxID=395010 RepID=A0ABR0E4Z3_ZASCE|nr:hypothetical protein PRZ48_012485 [Zasmidium cellare]
MADTVNTKPTPTTDQRESNLFKLPPELRVIIYEYVFNALHVKHSSVAILKTDDEQQAEDQKATSQSLRNVLPLLQICQLIRQEALPIYRARLNQIERELRAARGEEARKIQAEADAASERFDKTGNIMELVTGLSKKVQSILCSLYLAQDLEGARKLREGVDIMKRPKIELLDLPPELRLLVYEAHFSDINLDYAMHVAIEPLSLALLGKLDRRRRRYALPLPADQQQSFAPIFLAKQPLLKSCQTVRAEALPLYVARLEQIKQEAKSEHDRVVRIIESSEKMEERGLRLKYCKNELDCVYYTAIILREAAV